MVLIHNTELLQISMATRTNGTAEIHISSSHARVLKDMAMIRRQATASGSDPDVARCFKIRYLIYIPVAINSKTSSLCSGPWKMQRTLGNRLIAIGATEAIAAARQTETPHLISTDMDGD